MTGYGDEAIKPSVIAAAGVVPLVNGLDKTVTLIIVLVLGTALLYRLITRITRKIRAKRPTHNPNAIEDRAHSASALDAPTQEMKVS